MTARVTRKQARAWLAPMRECFGQMRTGFAPAADGFPVTRLHDADDWARIDYCIAGFVGLIARLFPELPTPHMARVQKRLAAGVLVSQSDLDGCLRECREAENHLITVTVAHLQSAVRTEQIAIEFDAMKEAA